MIINASCITNRGKIRKNNEDNLYFDGRYMEEKHDNLKKAITVQKQTEEISCFAVFDGVGGECFGETASFLAAAQMYEKMQELTKIIKAPREFLLESCTLMNRKICAEAEKNMTQGMASTAAMLYFCQDQVYVCNLGDSPVFRLRDGVLKEIHEEHTNRYFLEDRGITGRKPSITQCLGIPEDEMTLQPYVAKGDIKAGDQYLISSDGLTDMVSQEEIKAVLTKNPDASQCVETLMELVLEKGARDNTTMILCKIE